MRRALRRLRLPTHPLFHATLLLLTLLSTTFFGAALFTPFARTVLSSWPELIAAVSQLAFWRAGLTFSVPLLLILGAHEMGHYVTCGRYGLPATLPYFLPAPVGIGTFGAVIRIQAPLTNKKVLFDVGVAGPLAGFAVALPVLALGVTRYTPISPGEIAAPGTTYFSYPLLVLGMQKLLLGHTYSSLFVHESPPFMAAWFGLFVTALNLLPLSQLDGGHALYAVLGRRQRRLSYVLFAVLAVLSAAWIGWLLWCVIVFVLGLEHPPVADESEPLDPGRWGLAMLVLLVFIGCFTPAPIRVVGGIFR